MSPGRSADAARPAVIAAALLVGPLVAAKATRDALFLSTFDVSRLPLMAASAAIVSLLATLAFSRVMVRLSPARLLRASLGASAALFLVEWALALSAPGAAAVAVYLHHAVLGAVLMSGFWSLVNERFDPHSAKRAMGAIGAGASVGGVLGGLLTWRAAALVGPASMLAALSAASLLGLMSLIAMRTPGGGAARAPDQAPAQADPGATSGLRLIRELPFLRSLAALVALCAFVEAVLDYLLGAAATRSFAPGGPLMAFFAIFHAGTGTLSLLLQWFATRPALARLGVGGTLRLEPAFTLIATVLALFQPRLAAFVALRGGQAVLRNSLFRSSYELLYTPLPNEHKRPTKAIIDVACDRLGAVAGSGAVVLVLLVAPTASSYLLLAVVAAGAAASLALAPRFQLGYVGALARSLRKGSVALEAESVVDPTSLLTIASLPIEALTGARPLSSEPASAGPPSSEPASAPTHVPEDPLVRALAELCSGDVERISRVAAAREVEPRLVPQLIQLLAHDGLFPVVSGALRRASGRCTGQLVDALLDAGLPSVVRRRVARVLKDVPTQRAADGLMLGLSDPRFDVRYRSAQALGRLRAQAPEVAVPAAKLFEIAAREAARAGDSPRHLDHVFSVLAVVLEREPLEIGLRALRGGDPALRGTALEYLENVLPPLVRDVLWPHLGSPHHPPPSGRSADEMRDDLLRSTTSFVPRRPTGRPR